MKRFHSLLFVCWLVGQSVVYAGWNVPVTNYAVSDYAAGTQNWQLLTTDNGWLYAANNNGLLEFDGSAWRVYGLYYGNLPRSIAKLGDQAIFIGATNDFGVFRATPTGGMRYTSLLPKSVEPNFGEVWSIDVVAGQVYVMTRHLIITGTYTDADSLMNVQQLRVESRVFCSATIDDAVYVGTDNGLYLLSGTRMNRIHGSDILRGYEVRCIQALDSERLLIATDLGGLFVYDGTQITPFRTEADAFIRANQLYTFAVRNGTIALGTVQQGIAVVDAQGRMCRYVSRKDGLQNNTILSMAFDRLGNLWVGLDQGIDYVQLASTRQYFSDDRTPYGTGYAAIRVSRSGNDRYYFGTNQGLYVTDSPSHPLRLVEGSTGQVWSLAEVDGTLFCCHNRGLFVVDETRVQALCTDEGFWKVLPLPDGRLLAGSYSGFRVMEKASEVRGQQSAVSRWHLSKVRGFDDTAFRWQVDPAGTVWAVATSGVVRLEWQDDYSLRCENIQPYNGAHDWFNISRLGERILISSNDYCRVIGADGRLQRDEATYGQLNGEGYYALTYKDSKGNILYVQDGTLFIRVRAGEDYRPAQPIYNGASDFVGGFENVYESDGSYIVGALQGFCRLTLPDDAQPNSSEPLMLYMREAKLMNNNGEVVYGEAMDKEQPEATPRDRKDKDLFVLPFVHHNLMIRCAINRSPADHARYAFRLLPRDKEFTPLSERSFIEFSSLKEDHYTLEVICRYAEPNASPSEVRQSWRFTILPPWYRTWWARTLLVLFIALWLGGIGYIIYVYADRAKRRTLHDQQLRILQLENERTQSRLQAKSQELARILHEQAGRQEQIGEITEALDKSIHDLSSHNIKKAEERLQALKQRMLDKKDDNIDWQRFEENFDEVHAGFCKQLSTSYPWMNIQERKLCVYIHMGMLTKEIAPLLGLSTRGVEMMRYRMRCKMGLDPQANLKDYLTKITSEP